MVPKEQAEVGAVHSLILAEMAEQETWPTCIPAWHPRNDGTTGGDDGGADGAGSGEGEAGDTRTEGEKAAQEAVDKAYSKLREAEAERDRLQAEIKKRDRAGMEESERLKQEAEDAKMEAAAYREQLDKMNLERTVASVATTLKFKKPSLAMKFIEPSSTDEKAIRKDLEAAIKEIPELVSGGSAPPPVNNDNTNNNGSANARMNDALRKAAGRA